MILEAFTVHDSAVNAYLKPFFARNSGEATRMFADTVNSSESLFNRHPADYHLFLIGTYEDSTGVLDSCDHVNLGNAITFLEDRRNGQISDETPILGNPESGNTEIQPKSLTRIKNDL